MKIMNKRDIIISIYENDTSHFVWTIAKACRIIAGITKSLIKSMVVGDKMEIEITMNGKRDTVFAIERIYKRK